MPSFNLLFYFNWRFILSVMAMRSALDEILKFDKCSVVSIRGPWGVGKTHALNAYFEQKIRGKQIEFDRYSYVSLFGIDSLDKLKFSIFQQSVSIDSRVQEVTPKTFQANAKRLLDTMVKISSGSMLSLSYLKNFEFAAKSLAFLTIRDSLICLDDLERRSRNLVMRDLLGLVSILSEDRQCTVVLLHNENALDKSDTLEFNKLREKVIDIEIEFRQTPEECVEIAFPSSCAIYDKLKRLSIRLGIQNIRVLKKIKRFADMVAKILNDLEPIVLDNALHTLCLFVWCFYTPNDESPDYGYVKRSKSNMPGLDDDEHLNDEEKGWNALLLDYGFRHVDELDLGIAEVIENGYVDQKRLSRIADKINEQVLQERGQKSFSDIWDMYHNTFENNQEEFIPSLIEGFKKWVKYISPTNLHGTVRLLRGIKRDDLASEVIEYYIKQRRSEKELFDLENHPFSVDIKDSELIMRFKDLHNLNTTTRSLHQVIHTIAGKQGWSSLDEQILASHSEEDYYNFFKTEASEQLSSDVNACLQFDRLGNATERQKAIRQKTVNALVRISEESPLNKLWVKKFGIST